MHVCSSWSMVPPNYIYGTFREFSCTRRSTFMSRAWFDSNCFVSVTSRLRFKCESNLLFKNDSNLSRQSKQASLIPLSSQTFCSNMIETFSASAKPGKLDSIVISNLLFKHDSNLLCEPNQTNLNPVSNQTFCSNMIQTFFVGQSK